MKKKILILGSSSDIGSLLVEKLLKDKNYELFLHYNSNNRFKKKFNNCNLINANFTNMKLNKIKKKFKNNYDIIINLVGYISNQSFENFNESEFFKTLRANYLIPMLIIRKSLKHMEKNNFGKIINTSSIGTKFGGGKDTYSYSISKFINEFIPSHIKKLSKKNIIYNCLKIGVVNTKIHKSIKNKILKKRIKLIPLNRIAEPIEIVEAIIFLVKKNTLINNEIINISGGE